MPDKIRVCVAGATGWAGGALVSAVLKAPDLVLSGAVARRAAGQALAGVTVAGTVSEALAARTDVLVDYTRADAVKANALAAIAKGVHVVIGASGLTGADFKELEAAALKRGVGVIACGNFSITAALAKQFSLMAAKYVPDWEIIDYAHADKIDAPSGTVRELAESLAAAAGAGTSRPVGELLGAKETRGADIAGTRVHALRLPGYKISFETIFGLPDERLSIRHDSGSSAEPYIAGTLLAVRRVARKPGLIRGLDALLFEGR